MKKLHIAAKASDVPVPDAGAKKYTTEQMQAIIESLTGRFSIHAVFLTECKGKPEITDKTVTWEHEVPNSLRYIFTKMYMVMSVGPVQSKEGKVYSYVTFKVTMEMYPIDHTPPKDITSDRGIYTHVWDV